MTVYVRFGVLVRCLLCTVAITIAITTALIRPAQPDTAPPGSDPATSARR